MNPEHLSKAVRETNDLTMVAVAAPSASRWLRRGRAERQPWIPLALGGKATFDVATAARLTVDQWTRHKAFCFWCLAAAAATFATAPLLVDETRRAVATLFSQSDRPLPPAVTTPA